MGIRLIKSPTERQVKFADAIAAALHINFPSCSAEYTRQQYFLFIKNHVDQFRALETSLDPEGDDEYYCNYSYYGAIDVWGND